MPRRIARRLILPLALAAAGAAPAAWRASDVDIVLSVALDGSMLVRETLTINADASYRTPWRDILTRTTAKSEPAIDVEVLQVTRAGALLPWRVSTVDNSVRIHLGGARRRVPAGRRVYELLYHVDGHLGVDGDREWLLWRPLGEGMPAAVDRLSVRITFPRAIDHDKVTVTVAGNPTMTHVVGADGTVDLSANRTLDAGQGPAVLVGWPRGHLLTSTDSEVEPWMRPRGTALWLGGAGALALAVATWAAGRRTTPLRQAVPLFAAAVSLATLYPAGFLSTRFPSAFPAEFALAIACAAFAWLARHWLTGSYLRIAYLIIVTALAAIVTVRWVLAISPLFPLLVILHGDLFVAAIARARGRPRGRRGSRASGVPERQPPQPPGQSARTPLPVLDADESFGDTTAGERLPDGRRVPYFDTAGGRAPRPGQETPHEPQSSSGRW